MEIRKIAVLSAFCLYFGKTLISPSASIMDAAILLVLGSVAAFYEYKSNDNKIKELFNRLDNQQKELDQKSKDIEFLKSNIAGIKLGQGMRQIK